MIRKIFYLVILAMIASGYTTIPTEPQYPSPSGYEVDDANLIHELDKTRIDYLILELKRKTTAELVVVTVGSTKPLSIEEYAINLYKYFGIGQNGKDNGVLLLVAYKDHRMRITTGCGIKSILTDMKCSQIINQIMVPQFEAERFSQGILQATWAIVNIIMSGATQHNLN